MMTEANLIALGVGLGYLALMVLLNRMVRGWTEDRLWLLADSRRRARELEDRVGRLEWRRR